MTQLIDREQVLKEFEEMRKGFTQTSDYATGIKSGIDACTYRVINLPIQQSNEWIDVRERLPENDLQVLCYSKSENRQLVMRLDKYKNWSMQGAGYNFKYITHWQPLPTPPITNN